MVVTSGLGEKGIIGSYCLIGSEFHFEKLKSYEMGGGDGLQQSESTLCH
jgi:hypothetical protein